MTGLSTIPDEQLVAYLDGELDPAQRRSLSAALARDPALRARLAGLDIDKVAIRAAFDQVAAAAPIDGLRTGLARRRRPRPSAPGTWSRVAATLLLGAVLGYAAHLATADRAASDWHLAVADYQRLYTTATLASIAGDTAAQARDVALVSAGLGRAIRLDTLQVRGLDYKRAQLLEFEGRPLAQFAYLDPTGTPVAFCVTRTGEADGPVRRMQLRGLPAAVWSRDGFGFMLIGAVPAETLARLAGLLAEQR